MSYSRLFIVVLFWLLNLFRGQFIISFSLDKWKNSSCMRFVSAKMKIDSIFIWRAVVSYQFSSKAIKLITMFLLDYLKIDFHINPGIVLFYVCDCVFMKFLYNIFFENVNVHDLNVSVIVKRIFRLTVSNLDRGALLLLKRSAIIGNC